ncbi:MAG TPA: hypothetical protein VGR91_19140 [Stellaceae bacterium]|nr:hypothetical protein [Stellaceae bacterium]
MPEISDEIPVGRPPRDWLGHVVQVISILAVVIGGLWYLAGQEAAINGKLDYLQEIQIRDETSWGQWKAEFEARLLRDEQGNSAYESTTTVQLGQINQSLARISQQIDDLPQKKAR